MKRKAVRLGSDWPAKFYTMAERKWNMHIGPPVGPKNTVLHSSYHETDLTPRQRRAFLNFLVSRETPYMHQWLADVTHHFLNGTLTEAWINSHTFCKDLSEVCDAKITMVFNFPCDNEELPEDHFPLAFVISSN